MSPEMARPDPEWRSERGSFAVGGDPQVVSERESVRKGRCNLTDITATSRTKISRAGRIPENRPADRVWRSSFIQSLQGRATHQGIPDITSSIRPVTLI
jgi:hypothetical protein